MTPGEHCDYYFLCNCRVENPFACKDPCATQRAFDHKLKRNCPAQVIDEKSEEINNIMTHLAGTPFDKKLRGM